MLSNSFPIGYYINLNYRKDRRDHFEKNIISNVFFSNMERMEAIEHVNGSIGCGLSHLKCLIELEKKCFTKEIENVIIMEDDFIIMNDKNMKKFMSSFERIKDIDTWDVIVLTPRGDVMIENETEMSKNGFKRIINNQTATGYILKTRYISKLYECMKNGVEGMLRTNNMEEYAIDQIWKRLQIEDKYYYYNYIFAGQLPGWSDLEKRFVNYNNRFIMQGNL
jgi:GR25 family glycosyltransferase involved in LPS biosynthesis